MRLWQPLVGHSLGARCPTGLMVLCCRQVPWAPVA